MELEPRLRDTSMSPVQCGRRPLEIKLTYGQATNSYLQGEGSVVIVEGEAAQVLNFDTGELLYRAGSEWLE